MPLLQTRGAASAQGFGFFKKTGPVTGQQQYTGAGTYTWVCPIGVTSVSVVCVGGAVYGGGGLGYKNNITVVPGNSYTVVVSPSNQYNKSSYFINATTVAGNSPAASTVGGTYVGDGGGNGGNWVNSLGCGGGGAGGYSGNGGNPTANSTTAGSGAGGGGGGGFGDGSSIGGGGGGVGLLGQGSNGAGGTVSSRGGKGGSGGVDGTPGTSGTYSGGSGGSYGGGAGLGTGNFGGYGDGAVRIIWPGTTRSFPSTNTGNL